MERAEAYFHAVLFALQVATIVYVTVFGSSSARSRQGRDVDMPKEVTIKALTAWLRRNGFNELRGKKTGHRYFEKDHVKITLPGHGPGDLTKKHVGMILRQLEHMGYDRDAVRDEL